MKSDSEIIASIRQHLGDPASRYLFDGLLFYAECGNEEVLGSAFRDYFLHPTSGMKKDSPELLSLMNEAFTKGFHVADPGSFTPRQMRYFRGLGAVPEPYTDIYNCYFDSDLIHFTPDGSEVFIDGGAQDLFTSHRFHTKTRGHYKAVYAFEPDPENFREAENNRRLFDDRMHLSETALGDTKGTFFFTADRERSRMNDAGSIQVSADCLDRLLTDSVPTLLKLHLEGAELAALTGASETICRHHPRIAVCVDHNPADIFRIPAKLLELYPGYTFFLRHYSSSITETVLYALSL